MAPFILSKNQIYDLVQENKYPVTDKTKFLSRCIDGRYENTNKSLPPLAIPGGDAGELAILYATANSHGFEVDKEKAFKTLVKLVEGKEKGDFMKHCTHLGLHTDEHGDKKVVCGGCGHMRLIRLEPETYHLTQEDIDTLSEQIRYAENHEAHEVVLTGEHIEGAVLIIRGNYSVNPRFKLGRDEGGREVEVFVVHQGLIDERHKAWIKKLIEEKAVKLLDGLDEEYLYEVMSTVSEDHLMETAKRLAKGLPIFSVVFDEDGGFEEEEIGKVSYT